MTLTVAVRRDRRPYDLAGMTAHLVWQAADGKLVGPVPMEVTDPAAGTVRCTLPDACYSAVGTERAYIEISNGEELVDTTDEMLINVLDCIDADAEQAAEFTPLLGELQNAVAEEAKRVEAEKARAQAETERATGFAEAKQASQAATKAANDAAEGANLAASSASTAAKSANTAAGKATNAAAKAESDVRAFVNAAGTAIGDAIAAAREDVDAAVKRSDAATAKAEAAVKTADAANTAATQAVGDAQDAIAEVKATEAKLYPAAENILVGSETGAVAHVEDAFDGAAMRKITVEGACKQDGIPSPDAPKPITVVENPVVKVTGADTSAVSTSIPFALPAEHPYLAKLPSGRADTIEVDADGNVELVARVGIDKDVRVVGDFLQGQYYELKTGISQFASASDNYNGTVLCSALPYKNTSSNGEGIYRTWNGVYVKDTSGRTKEEIQAEVDKNAPLTVVAPIPETRYQLGKIELPKTQDSIVNAWTDAEVTPNTGIEYVRDVNIVVSNLESAIASITQG